jgi:hypothetical protein
MDIESCIERVPFSGCWIWTKTKLTEYGYGRIRLDGKDRLAHRVSYEQFIGAIPNGLLVCHHCDVRSCVNPDHLYVGTIADNMDDAVRRGWKKVLPGEKHQAAKLTEEAAREIKAKLTSIAEAAAKFGVSETTVKHIRYGITWRHI